MLCNNQQIFKMIFNHIKLAKMKIHIEKKVIRFLYTMR